MDKQNRVAFDPKWEGHKLWGEGYVVAITAIDEVTIDNSPLYVYPRSHLLQLNFHRFCNENELPEILKNYEKVPLLLKPGETVFMHSEVVHGSLENNNTDGKTRTTFLNGFSSPGANHAKYPGEGSGEQVTLDNRGMVVNFLTKANMLTEAANLAINALETYRDGITKSSLKAFTGGIKLAGMYQESPVAVLSSSIAETVAHEWSHAGLGAPAGYMLAYGALTALYPTLALVASVGLTAYAGYQTIQDGYNLYH
jgi:hypothetical protein